MTLTFQTDGHVICLWTDALDLRELGTVKVDRVSTIDWDEANQYWRVHNRQGRTLFHHNVRQACVDWEHDHESELLA